MENTKQKKKKSTNKTNRSNSLQRKILVPFLVLIIITGVVLSYVSYTFSVQTTTDELTKSVENEMVALNDTFNMFFNNVTTTLERLSASETFLNAQAEDKDELTALLKETTEANSSMESVYTGTTDGEMIDYPQMEEDSSYDVKEREWYQDAISAEGDIVWTEPYIDADTEATVVTASKAYYNNDEFTGVMAADFLIDTLIDMVDEHKIGETGYAMILGNNGKLIAHPDEASVGEDQSEKDYYKQMVDGDEHGLIEHELDGNQTVTGFSKNEKTGWVIAGMVPVKDLKQKAQTIFYPISITLIIMLVIAVVASLMIARHIIAPIKKVMNRMRAIADGDLSNPPLEAKSNDETGQLVGATNEMNDSMRQVLNRITTVSETVTNQSEELTHYANEVKGGTDQVSSTMEELASGAETEARTATDLSSSMQQFAQNVDTASNHGEQIRSNSGKVTEITDEGSQLMHSSKEQMVKIDDVVKDAVKQVQGLDVQSKEISKLVSVIQDIAEQTNLLALNAAIEAARAGEHGQGFAVVADEVRKLAEQVSESVTDITGIVNSIQEESEHVVKSLQTGYEDVEQGTSQIEVTSEKFEGINQSVNDMAESVQSVTESLSNIAASSQQMNGSIQEIAAISEESAAGIEETSASSEEISASMEGVTSSSSDLSKLADELNELIKRFKL